MELKMVGRSLRNLLRGSASSLSLALMLMAAEARADEPITENTELSPTPAPTPQASPAEALIAPPSRTPEALDEVWYGWQTLVADAAALATGIAGGVANSGPVAGLAYGGYVLAPPIVHWTHGKVGIGFASLSLRVFAPPGMLLIGALFGGLANHQSPESGAAIGAMTGLIAGYIGTVVIDAALFGYEKQQPTGATRGKGTRELPRFTASPTFDANKSRATFGLAGTF
jgi:hypothetical protein